MGILFSSLFLDYKIFVRFVRYNKSSIMFCRIISMRNFLQYISLSPHIPNLVSFKGRVYGGGFVTSRGGGCGGCGEGVLAPPWGGEEEPIVDSRDALPDPRAVQAPPPHASPLPPLLGTATPSSLAGATSQASRVMRSCGKPVTSASI